MDTKVRFVIVGLVVALAGCGGGGSSDGGGDSADAALDQFALREIQFLLDMPDYQPNAAEIACVRALPENDDVNARTAQVQACVDNN